MGNGPHRMSCAALERAGARRFAPVKRRREEGIEVAGDFPAKIAKIGKRAAG